ncbi:hypothetical protein ABIB25_002960 [Nakamurella sp. UYEF19]|uniref:hypothetical protein n=1 Tax=Nakamurella sp. UYEF19 TaxID=1756392 RepID=UPI003397C3C9
MTTSPRSAELRIEADLRIDVDGQRASLVGQGQRLTFTTQDPGQLLASLRDTPLPAGLGAVQGVRAIGRLANALGAQGLEFHVAGPDGDLVHLGAGAHSRWGRAVTGSSLIKVRSLRAVSSFALPAVRRSRFLVPSAAAVVVAAAGVVFARGRMRNRDSRPQRSAL